MERVLEVKNLRVSYHTYAGEVQSVRNVNFYINKGETLAIVGESGCGKTVTAKSIMRLIQEPPGEIKKGSEIIFNGKNILDMKEKELRELRGADISMIFQDPMTSLNPTMKIGNQIAESLIIHKKISKSDALKEVVNILKLVNIPNAEKRINQYPYEFSGGMRQRVMIAIALACDPKILIADEPTTALDVTIQAQIMELIKDLQQKMNTAVIMITHDLGVVANVAHRIQVMYAGKIVERGTTNEIFCEPKHPYTLALLKSVPRLDTKHKGELYSLEGTPPDLIKPPKGCPFASRCEYCMKICKEQIPDLTKLTETHEVLCWLQHPMAQKMNNSFLSGGDK
ncbi:ABC transporter ATP-binding protein [Clostridium sp. Marseille-Q2269]|uniref:ABC transporter ATP-binding protein n=1 Tax=Clostridium sp. Marseille-Q2269 TaxID=2942205 RepID=UPI0020735B42|nr:ABC transporter ATP-binding protein [Clostridium sp. Marseille-Q2269]